MARHLPETGDVQILAGCENPGLTLTSHSLGQPHIDRMALPPETPAYMPLAQDNLPSSRWSLTAQDLGLIALGFTLYWLAYEFHELLLPYVSYAQGVELLFLPAGIKLVMVMVASWRGALGCGLALFSLSARFWPGLELHWQLGYAALSVGMTWLVVGSMLRRKALGPNLDGLSFWDVVQIDAVNTVLHGVAVNSYFWALGLRSSEALWSSALAMALGDFLGTGVVMLLVLAAARFLVPATR